MYAMQIQTVELRETDLPAGYGEWSDYARFAVTFAPRDRDLCTEAASDAFARWRRTGDVPRTLEELRACPGTSSVVGVSTAASRTPRAFAMQARSAAPCATACS